MGFRTCKSKMYDTAAQRGGVRRIRILRFIKFLHCTKNPVFEGRMEQVKDVANHTAITKTKFRKRYNKIKVEIKMDS